MVGKKQQRFLGWAVAQKAGVVAEKKNHPRTPDIVGKGKPHNYGVSLTNPPDPSRYTDESLHSGRFKEGKGTPRECYALKFSDMEDRKRNGKD